MAVIRLELILLLSAYAINQPRSSFILHPETGAWVETRRGPIGSLMFQHIINEMAVSIASLLETQSSRMDPEVIRNWRKSAVHEAKHMAKHRLISGGGMITTRNKFALLAAMALFGAAAPADSQALPAPVPTYADLADLALTAPVAAHARVLRATALKAERTPGMAPGLARFVVDAQIVSLIRAPEGLPSRVSYVVDLPRDTKGRAPKLRKGTEFLLLAQPVAGRPGEIRLVAPDAQIGFAPDRAEMLRAILREGNAADAAPRITGIGRAFHVPGAIPGESETQIFLLTADNRPVSLSVLRRPGQTPVWSVALSEIIDDAAGPPRPNTLLWYRLACTLPRALPRQSLAEADAAGAAAIQADYRLILERLGPCVRTRARR
jgi:hypothetical protein